MSDFKPMRHYVVCTGPIIVPNGEDYYVAVPPTEHEVYGRLIKGTMIADMGYFQVLDSRDQVVFSSPTHMVLWCRAAVSKSVTTLRVVEENPVDEPAEEA